MSPHHTWTKSLNPPKPYLIWPSISFLTTSPSTFPYVDLLCSNDLASLLFLKYSRQPPALAGSVNWLLIPFVLNLLPPDNYMFPSFSSFRVLLKCHLSGAFPNNSIKIATLNTPFLCFIFSLYITSCHLLYYIFYFFIVCLSQLEITNSMGLEIQSFVHNYILSN